MNNILEFWGFREESPYDVPRRTRVRRTQADFDLVRTMGVPERYRSGLPLRIIVPYKKPEPTKAEIRAQLREEKKREREQMSFLRRHRVAFAAVAVILVLAIGLGIYANSIWHDDTLFIGEDIGQTGSAVIEKKITSTPEMLENVVYVLVVGVDASSLLTDCVWVMCYDIAKQEVNVLQVPRDTYVGNESVTGKFNALYQRPKTVKYCDKCDSSLAENEIRSGRHDVCGTKISTRKESNINCLIRNINEHLGLPIDHFVLFNFEGFATAIDTIGGVDVTLDKPLNAPEMKLSQGVNHLDGDHALKYMRHRSTYIMGDLGRVQAQQKLIEALLSKMLSLDLGEMLGLVTKCTEYFNTDMTLGEMETYAKAARGLQTSNFAMHVMPGYDHWVRPNPSYYCCDVDDTIDVINQYMLPYGMPGGGMANSSTVKFPEVVDKITTTQSTEETTTEPTTQKTTEPTTEKTTATTTATTTSKTSSTTITTTTTVTTTEKTTTTTVEETTTTTVEETTTTVEETTVTSISSPSSEDAPEQENT